MERLLRWLIGPRNSGLVLAVLMVVYYGGTMISNPALGSDADRELVLMLSLISGASVLVGWFAIPAADRVPAVPLAYREVYWIAVAGFGAFALFTILTAPTIPLLAAIGGEDVQDIAIARENFLKAREGLFAILPYVNGVLTFTLVPYAMCLAFIARIKGRWILFVLFLAYSMIFVEKAFFVRVLAPMAALVVVTRTQKVSLSLIIFVAMLMMAANIQLSGFADGERDIAQFFFYRLLEVPAQTAIDTISFWRQTWGGNHLLGATNLLLSNLFFMDRINLERMVFEYQVGAFETGTGSANSVFFVDAYVNFGILGVVVTSALVGVSLKHVGRSADPAFRCIAPLIVYSVFFASFLSVLFGNGLLIFLLLKPMLTKHRSIARVPKIRGKHA